MKKQTMITLDNEFKKEAAQAKVAKLEAITKNNFHNYTFGVCPVGGSFDIVAFSDYEFEGHAEMAMMQDLLYILTNQI